MKAIQVKQPGGLEAMELVDLPVPEPRANEAVVKLSASGVNFIDVYFREGRYKAPLPLVLGQEGAGAVAAVGADAQQRVADEGAGQGCLGRDLWIRWAAQVRRSIERRFERDGDCLAVRQSESLASTRAVDWEAANRSRRQH